MSKWSTIYDLAEDRQYIRQVQRATTETEDFGVLTEVALFGSEGWWRAIRDGRIPLYVVEGPITKLLATGHGDWPEFEMRASGEIWRWTREGRADAYKEGELARVEYIVQKAKKKRLDSREFMQVIRISVQNKTAEATSR